jgi:hypothetical protein
MGAALTAPALGLVFDGLTHATKPDAIVNDQGWAPAFCRSSMLVSVEHVPVGRVVERDGRRVWMLVNQPERATATHSPTLDGDGNVIGEGVDCLLCSRALERWEAAHPEAVAALAAEAARSTSP